jgi:hypothetical protein
MTDNCDIKFMFISIELIICINSKVGLYITVIHIQTISES